MTALHPTTPAQSLANFTWQTEAEREAQWKITAARLNKFLTEQRLYERDPVYASASDADRVARQAAVYRPMDLIRDAALARRDAQGDAR